MQLDLSNGLSRLFVGPKPINTVLDKVLLQLQDQRRLRMTRKRDGHCHYGVTMPKGAKLYTRELVDVTKRYPHIVEELNQLRVPAFTLMSMELFVAPGDCDSLPAMGKARMLDPVKLSRYLSEVRVEAMLLNVFIEGNVDVTHHSHQRRFDMLHEYVLRSRLAHFRAIEFVDEDLETAQKIVLDRGWEGLVCYDANASTKFELHGRFASPPRPVGAWKRKPLFEDDFVARGFVVAKEGKNAGRLKDFKIYQYNPAKGNFVYCGHVSLGLSLKQRLEYIDESKYPVVLQVAFDARTSTGKLRSGRIMHIRDDKLPEECVFPNNSELKLYEGPRKKSK